MAGRGDSAAAIYRECRAAAAIRHRNIARIQAVGEEKNGLYIVTEWLTGQSLRALLDHYSTYPVQESREADEADEASGKTASKPGEAV